MGNSRKSIHIKEQPDKNHLHIHKDVNVKVIFDEINRQQNDSAVSKVSMNAFNQ